MTTARDISRITITAIENWFDRHIETCAPCVASTSRFCDAAEKKLATLRTILEEDEVRR